MALVVVSVLNTTEIESISVQFNLIDLHVTIQFGSVFLRLFNGGIASRLCNDFARQKCFRRQVGHDGDSAAASDDEDLENPGKFRLILYPQPEHRSEENKWNKKAL